MSHTDMQFDPEKSPEGKSLTSGTPSVGKVEDDKYSQPEPEPQPVPQTPDFPDGGLQAWLTVAGASLVQYCMFGYINAFGVYQDYYVRQYLVHFSPSTIGWIGGVQVFFNFSLGAITGRIFDRGYFYHLMIAGTILQAVALFMLSLSHENSYYQVFLTNGLCFGLASGLTYVPSLSIVGHYFRKRRPLAMGIVSSGSALGAVLNPIMLNKLINGHIGFHNGVRISAALNTFLLLVALSIMRTRLPPKTQPTPFPFLEFMRQPTYFIAVIGGILGMCGLFFPVFYLQLDSISHGVEPQLAFYALSILNTASILGRSIPSALAPRLGVFNLLIFFSICTGIVTLCMAVIKDTAGTAIFAVFFGFFSGGLIAMTPAMLGQLSKDMSEIGSRMGIYFGIAGILGLFATPIAGALLTSQYHWINAILFAGITLIMSGLFFLGTRHLLVKQKRTKWL